VMCFSLLVSDLSGQKLPENYLKDFHYRSIGPTRQGGRYVDFAVVKDNPITFYCATASGGLWKTVNNGITYTSIFDNESVISIGDVAVADTDPNIVWVGTGEANNSRTAYYGDGVYKSTDAGETWTNMGLKESHHIGRIIIHPKNPDIVYIAAEGHLYSENPERGIYKTTNGGKSWEKILEVIDHKKYIGAIDLAIDPSDSNILYAAMYDRVRRAWTFNEGGPGSGIYKTTDAGENWKQLKKGLPGGMIGKIGLEVSVSNPNVLYANIENANAKEATEKERYQDLLAGRPTEGGTIGDEMYRSDDKGETWYKTHPDDVTVGGGPPYYYQQVRIDPNDEDHVYVLGMGMFETKDGGKTWKSPFRFGGDNHGMWIDPANSEHIMLGYDHGMGISYDAGKNWLHPDNIPLAQAVAVGLDNNYPYNVYTGLQDNGSKMGPSSKRNYGSIVFEDWQNIGGGDGMYNVVDINDEYLYNESQNGPISRRNLKTGETKSIRYRPTDGKRLRWAWNAPIITSQYDAAVVYHASNIVVKTTNRGESWTEISPDLTTNNEERIVGTGNIQYCTIVTMDESPILSDLLWVGTDDGNVHVTKDGGKNWTLLNENIPDNPGHWISRVEASNHNPAVAYVTMTGYRCDDFKPYVYKTSDYGQTWESIASNLPNEPLCVIREDYKNPGLLFVGTTMSVYVSVDGGKYWNKLRGNLPTTPVEDIKIHPRENDLVLGTHGRGIFIADISPLQEMGHNALDKDALLFNIEPNILWERTARTDVSSANYNGESEKPGVHINYYLKNDQEKDVIIKIYQGHRVLDELKVENTAGIHQATWNLSARLRKFTDEEKEQRKQQSERMTRRARERGFNMPNRGSDPEYLKGTVGIGEYTVELCVGDIKIRKTARVMKDHWAN
ncbi:WD40/YVTN/BNR-like repeat-containing protein, partial [Bacteroidota bacterium]